MKSTRRSWSVVLAVEAIASAGIQTLCAPLTLFVALAPMELSGALAVLGACLAMVFALYAFWTLALATIEGRAFVFGRWFWIGVLAALLLLSLTFTLEGSAMIPWAVAVLIPLLTGAHFVVLQLQRRRSFGI